MKHFPARAGVGAPTINDDILAYYEEVEEQFQGRQRQRSATPAARSGSNNALRVLTAITFRAFNPNIDQ